MIEVGFEVQSDNLTLKTAQSVVFAIDLEIFDVLKKDLSAIEITSTGAFVKVSGKALSIFNELASSDAVDWGGSLYLAKSEDGEIGYVMIQPAQDDDSFECKTKCTLASIFLGLKSGKTLSAISKSSIRFAVLTGNVKPVCRCRINRRRPEQPAGLPEGRLCGHPAC